MHRASHSLYTTHISKDGPFQGLQKASDSDVSFIPRLSISAFSFKDFRECISIFMRGTSQAYKYELPCGGDSAPCPLIIMVLIIVGQDFRLNWFWREARECLAAMLHTFYIYTIIQYQTTLFGSKLINHFMYYGPSRRPWTDHLVLWMLHVMYFSSCRTLFTWYLICFGSSRDKTCSLWYDMRYISIHA